MKSPNLLESSQSIDDLSDPSLKYDKDPYDRVLYCESSSEDDQPKK